MISRKASLAVCALLLGGQAAFLLLRPQQETLLRRATPLLPDGGYSAYFWLSNDEALLLRPGGEAMRSQPGGELISATDLGKALADSDGPPVTERPLQLSPDRKWLLWQETRGDRIWFAARVADGRRLEWDTREGTGRDAWALWMPDSRRWVELKDERSETLLRVRSINAAGAAGDFEIRHGFMAGYYQHLGFLDATRAIGITPWVGDGAVTVVEYEVRPNPPPRRIFFLKVPPDAYGRVEVALSPRGDRLAWRFEHKPPPLGLAFLNRTRLVKSFQPSRVGLWISRPDGGGMRRIGDVSARPGALHSLRWTPDGRRVSFLHAARLWSVPVD